MRQITFELLRHGPLHNQLLSPLTQYLALCENHSAVTLHVPFEHNQFLHRLRALSYQIGEESRCFQVTDSARALGEVLSQVPGLVAELNRDPQGAGGEEPRPLTHLRLVTSASELALLPFELALAPPGFPGAGQSLVLQFQSPVCLTREVRRVPERVLDWPRDPRVLFVSASPANVPTVPADDHWRALREILKPWIEDPESEAEVTKHLVVLRDASCQDIERACAGGGFSHIHILAHGIEYKDGYDVRFGLALHNPADPRGPADPVSGERLATAIRPVQTCARTPLGCPVVVTLASCNSGNQGGVIGMGGSIAHALHAAGIPMVIASQFPLSVPGAMLLLNVLYPALLWGKDPRIALNDLQRRLYSQFPATHDWASITSYLSLPPDFESRMYDVQIRQTTRSMEVQMNFADRATAEPQSQPDSTRLAEARQRIEAGRQRLERLLEQTNDPARVYGLLASVEKRSAEVYFSFGRVSGASQNGYRNDWILLLQQARQHYWDAFLASRDNSWGVVQYLSLDLLLRNLKPPVPHVRMERIEEHNSPEALWTLAHVTSINDLRAKDELTVRWALGNLIELYILSLLIWKQQPKQASERAVQRAQDLIDRAGTDAFEVYSTRRQMLRYLDWYSEIADLTPLIPTVSAVLDVFPQTA